MRIKPQLENLIPNKFEINVILIYYIQCNRQFLKLFSDTIKI